MSLPCWQRAAEEAARIAADWAAPGTLAPGGVVLTFDRNGPRDAMAAGLADLAHRQPFDAHTPTRIASLTKGLFAAFALHRGMDLRAPLAHWLPRLAPAIGSVTLERALSMTGALPDLLQTAVLLGLPHTAAVDLDALDTFCDRLDTLDGEPGTEFCYSNTGYRLAERATQTTGAAFGEWLVDTVNPSLGMRLAYPCAFDRPVDALASGYWRESPAAPWRTGRYGPGLSASGAATGCAHDLAAWFSALLRGEGPAGPVLDELAQPVALRDGRSSEYGLGLATSVVGPHRWIGHGGHLPGYKNYVLIDRTTNAGVIVLSNREDTDPYAAALRVMLALHGDRTALAPAAAFGLPEGLFLSADASAWLEHRAGEACFLGSTEKLYSGDATGIVVSRTPYLPMRLQRDGDAITGRIGHRTRSFAPLPNGLQLDRAFDGTWTSELGGALLEIDSARGTARLGLAALRHDVRLEPMGTGCALLPVGAPPWRSRAMMRLSSPDRLLLATHRSRRVVYRRVSG